MIFVLFLISVAGAAAAAQVPPSPRDAAFESACVRPSEPGPSEERCAPNANAGRHFGVRNCPLGALVLFAYNVLQEQVSGQTGLLSETYDITADAERPVSRAQMKGMLQKLLEDRLQLKLRREVKVVPVYALTTAKDGPNFRRSTVESEDEGPRRAPGPPDHYVLQNAAMADLIFALSRRIKDRIVVDQTGLEGKFDLDMSWYLSLGKPDPPTVFDAIQEIGLRLEAQTRPVEYLVIEHVARARRN